MGTVKDESVTELLASGREGDAILRGDAAPSRSFDHPGTAPDVKAIREDFGSSQTEFAGLFGISVNRLRDWE